MAIALFIPIAIIVISVAIFSGGGVFGGLDLSLPDLSLKLKRETSDIPAPEATRTPKQQQAPRTFIRPAPPSPFFLNTIITAGPKENEVLPDTTTVMFEFSGVVLPESIEGQLTFETKVEGFDEEWKPTSLPARKIALPPGPKEYTFLARSKLKDTVDLTPASRIFKINTSPYFGKVKISRISPPRDSRPSTITLTTRLAGEETIPITGWEFESRIERYTIPKGREVFGVFDTSRIPKTDIILQNGTKLFISTGINPLANNFNFQPNQCFGHFAKDRRFPISVPSSCPNAKPTKEEISFLSPTCQDFILRKIGKCEIPDYSQNLKIIGDFDCHVYLKDVLKHRYTYEYCYQQHSEDRNFVRNEWHIYTDGEEFLRPGHDRVILRDQNGLFVHEVLY